MRTTRTICALALACSALAACAQDSSTVTSAGDGNHTNATGFSNNPAGEPGMACPLGAPAYAVPLGESSPEQHLSLALDAHGNAYVAGDQNALGVTEIDAHGRVVRSFKGGSLVATSANGELVFAGSFDEKIDLGAEIGELVPQGNIDVFVVALDARGHVVFARALNLCGDGVMGLAVDATGRIAVSGTALGTVVLTAAGALDFQVASSGKVAFDSRGDLVIAGSLETRTGSNGFVTMVDRAGNPIFDEVIDGSTVLLEGVAIGAGDRLAVAGQTGGTADVFGTTITARASGESGRVSGAFAFVLDPMGNAELVKDLGIVEASSIAFGLSGDLYIAGAETGNTGFFRLVSLVHLGADGTLTYVQPEFDGRDAAVAVDACGSVVLGVVKLDTPSPASTVRAALTKLTF